MFHHRLIHPDGSPADPDHFETAVPSWREGETFLARPGRVYRIVEIRDDGETWVVELE